MGPAYLDSLSNALIGTGPNSFPYAWSKYRPVELNATSLWTFIPTDSYSTVTALATEDGLLGVFAFLLCSLLILGGCLFRLGPRIGAAGEPAFEALFALAAFSFAAAVVYPVGLPILSAGGIALGACACSVRFPIFSPRTLARRQGPVIAMVAVVIFCAGVLLASVSLRQVFAAWYDARGMMMLDAGDTKNAAPVFGTAVRVWGTSEYMQHAALAYVRAGTDDLGTSLDAPSQVAAQDEVNRALAFADSAVGEDPRDFSAWIFRASLNLALIEHGIGGDAAKTQVSLGQASLLSPTRPDVPYLEATLALVQGDKATARPALHAALVLKPDYTDALKLQQDMLSGQ
jgi:hypothetical protein